MSESLGWRISRSVEKYRGRVEPRHGDCGNIASALIDFFQDKETYEVELVSISSDPSEHKSEHFCVRINDCLYDGFGRTNAEEMAVEFGDYNSRTNVDATEYLYAVESVESENYIINYNLRDRIVENLESEFSP